jgi:predicted AlkP superfamily pyrophosphatase or phosphodiesterase
MLSLRRSWFGGALCGALCSLLNACAAPARRPAAATESTAGHAPTGAVKRVILVSLDGMLPDTYVHPDAHGLRVPTLRWLVQNGAVSSGVESVFPTLTYPSHTSMVTGVNPGKHGIVSNGTFDPTETDMDSWRWYAEDIKVEPVWRLAQRAGDDTAIVHWPVTLGADVKWILPEFWRAKDVQDQKLMRVVSTPGLLDDVAKEQPGFWNRYVPPQASDDSLTDVALHILKHGEPRLLLLHLVGIDGAQHRHGIDSAEAHAAIENDDAQLARIFATLDELGQRADTAVMVVSDHGFRAASKMVRPCALLREAGLVTVVGGKVASWKASALSNSGSTYVYVQDPADYATREVVRALFAAKSAQADSGIGRLYEASEIRARGGDPAAFLAVEAAADYQFGGGCTTDYVAPPQYVATHGFDPKRPEMQASLLMVGPGIAHGMVENAHIVDVGPTIAAWLGLAMPNVDGAPLRVTAAH